MLPTNNSRFTFDDIRVQGCNHGVQGFCTGFTVRHQLEVLMIM